MKILHTSDWHLGRTLYGRKRYREFAAFLDWLIQTLDEEQVDVLLVAGDIFDTGAPSHRAQSLYYRFLCRLAESHCRHVVVVAGNHDSPSFLNAPKELLRSLHVHVIGSMESPVDKEVLVLCADDRPEAIVCAVPYLRDQEIRTVGAGETIDEKNERLIAGLRAHYAEVCAIAERKRDELQCAGHRALPIIAMGHLFAAGGKTVEGDGVRELYVGSLAHVDPMCFPQSIDYLALGHLHGAQTVGGHEHLRYSGSPIPMGYGEATQTKKVVLVEWSAGARRIRERRIPCFQELVRIVGSLEQIDAQMVALRRANSSAWLEIEYTGRDWVDHLNEQLQEAASGSNLEIRRVKSRRVVPDALRATAEDEQPLEELGATEVFRRCLDAHEIPAGERAELFASYREIIQSLHDDDLHAE